MVKTLTIRDVVYNKLVKMKGDRSFSQLLEGFTEPKPFTGRDLEAFVGTITKTEADGLRAQSRAIRKGFSAGMEKRRRVWER